MKQRFNNITIECIRGDIADQHDVDAVVNAANAELKSGGGVAGAIHQAAGTGLERETRPLAPIAPGEAVVTGAHDLPNDYVIHTLGPVYGHDEPGAQLLADCYRNALRRAEENQITSVAFPAISTGAFGYPLEEAAQIAVVTVIEEAARLERVERIRFVLFSDNDFEVFKQKLSNAL